MKVCQGKITCGTWSVEEQNWYINIPELLAVKLALLNFTMEREVKLVYFQTDTTTALR